LIGSGPAMDEVLQAVARVAPSTSTVLLQGESGTGKELVARAIHLASRRALRPFHCENCAALTETLVESELFGHVRGAFTGATDSRAGIFQLAHGGTLLLDEIGDLSLRMQGKLLRVLQEGEFRQVGGRELVRVDVRIVSATHRDLRRLTEEGAFREDLYYRLNVFELRLPPLRERPEDISMLVEHFLAQLGAANAGRRWEVSDEAMDVLRRYPWPGNIRELRNILERATLVADAGSIDIVHLPEQLVRFALAEPAGAYGKAKGAERLMIEEALLRWSGNKARAAAWIGWNRPKLYRRMKKLGIGTSFGARKG
jgi:DNA-binding NtrC family response regulator